VCFPGLPLPGRASFDAGVREAEQVEPLVVDELPDRRMPCDDGIDHFPRRVDEHGEPQGRVHPALAVVQ
jgi:hypothetical protein